MQNALEHEIELYPPEAFKTLLDHEINRSRRYGHALTLLHLTVEADPASPQAQHSAEVFAINVLNLHLRETDIPCKRGNEFLVLMPATDVDGGRIACERLETLLNIKHQTYDRVSFKLFAFMGMATLPGDRSMYASQLLRNAAQAMQEARANRQASAAVFTEMKE